MTAFTPSVAFACLAFEPVVTTEGTSPQRADIRFLFLEFIQQHALAVHAHARCR